MSCAQGKMITERGLEGLQFQRCQEPGRLTHCMDSIGRAHQWRHIQGKSRHASNRAGEEDRGCLTMS